MNIRQSGQEDKLSDVTAVDAVELYPSLQRDKIAQTIFIAAEISALKWREIEWEIARV